MKRIFKRRFKRVLSICIAFALIFSMIPIMPTVEIKAVGMSLAQLQAKFPHGAYWNHVVKAGHYYANNGYNDIGSCNNPDAYTWTPCATHNGNVGIGGYDCNSYGLALQCCGFAKKIADDIYGSNHSSWPRVSKDNLKPGDVINYVNGDTTDKENGHWAMVIRITGDTLYLGECNVGSNCRISWNRALNKNGAFDRFNVYSAPYSLTGGQIQIQTQSPTLQVVSCNYNEYNIFPSAKIYNPNRSKITTCGIEIKHGNTVIARKEEQFDVNYNTSVNGNVYYDCQSECGVTLESGTTYTWNIYAYVGGQKIETGWQTVTTKGNPTPDKPNFTTSSKNYAVGDAATVSWSPDQKAKKGYLVTITQISGGDYTKTLETTSSNATSLAFTLPNEGEYKITGYARGESKNSDVVTMSRTIVAHGDRIVQFVEELEDGTTNLLSYQKIKYGYSATAPTGISRKGHTFMGWDKEYSSITEDITITAQFKRNTYTVTFVDKDNKVIQTESVLYEDSATAPEPPEAEEGYVFAGWDNEEYKYVEENITVKACYVWANPDLPVIVTINSCKFDEDGYIVNYNIKNYDQARTKGRALVSLRTSTGKLLDTTESNPFSLAKGEEKTGLEMYVPYEGAATMVSMYIIDGFSNGIPISETSTIEVSRDWSDWSGEAPEGDYEIETRTEYRYKDKQKMTTRTSVNDGWELYDKVLDPNWTLTYSSGWSRTQYYPSETTTTKREVFTKPVQDSAAYTLYNWYYYRYWNSSAGTYYYTYSSSMGGTLYTAQTTYMFPWIGNYSGHDGYKPNGGMYFANEIWFLLSTKNVPATYHTEWSYKDYTKGYTYYWYKWNDWSDWSGDVVTATDDRQVETRTAYRYRVKMSDIEDNSGKQHNVSGSVDASLAGKEALIQVYKGNEPSDSNNEYIGKVTIAEDGSYDHTFVTREEVSADTGDYTIMMAIEGGTEPIYLGKIEAPKPQYTVVFKDIDGNIIDTQIVKEGSSATSPIAPDVEHYTFIGWDFGVTNIRDDMVITAQYTKNKYSVAFVNWDTREVDTVLFTYGAAVTYPDVTEIEGYDFIGWTTPDGETIENIVDNTVLVANYQIQTYTIEFYDNEGNLISTQDVQYGEDAVAPEEPQIDKMEFLSWSSYGYIQAKGDLKVYPMYQYIETTPEPSCDLESGVLSESVDVHLTAEQGATIYYTTDGTLPTKLSNVYDGQVTIDKNTFLQYMAVSPDKNESIVKSASYLLISSEDDEGALVVKRDSYNLERGETRQITYFLSHEDENIGVEFYSLDESVASIDSEGNVRANQVGETRIFVRTSDSRYADYCDIIVTTDDIDAEYIELSEWSVLVTPDSIVKIDAEVYPDNATEKGIDWYVDDPSVATVDENGNVTVVGEGVTILRAISKTGKCYAECIIEGERTMKQEKMYLSDGIVALNAKESKQVTAYYSGREIDVDWYSYDETVATVDENGNITAVNEGYTMVSAVAENGIYVTCTVIVNAADDTSEIVISDKVKVEGYQISTTLGGSRVVGSVEPEINGQKVAKWGFVYALESNGITNFSVPEEDIIVGSDNKYVVSYESTEKGTINQVMGDSDTATYYVRTMLFAAGTAQEFNAEYKVRAFALLEDGSYVYSDVNSYTIYDICDYLYKNNLMSSADKHEYLYNNVLTVVNKEYEAVEYSTENSVVQ